MDSVLSLLGAGLLGLLLTHVDIEIKVLGSNVFNLGEPTKARCLCFLTGEMKSLLPTSLDFSCK